LLGAFVVGTLISQMIQSTISGMSGAAFATDIFRCTMLGIVNCMSAGSIEYTFLIFRLQNRKIQFTKGQAKVAIATDAKNVDIPPGAAPTSIAMWSG